MPNRNQLPCLANLLKPSRASEDFVTGTRSPDRFRSLSSRRIKILYSIILGLVCFHPANLLFGGTERPNILLFFTDDQRPSTIGALGNSIVQTPNLDWLVGEGMTFTRAYMMGGMTGATCVPSRAMLHTGQHLFHLRNRGSTIAKRTPTLGETFRKAGYHTYFTGKRHSLDRQAIQRGFESGGVVMGFAGYFTDKRRMPMHDWDPDAAYMKETGYVLTGDNSERLTIGEIQSRKLKPHQFEPGPFATQLYIDPAVEFLRKYDDARPFFMYVALSAPHDPHQAPGSIHQLYDSSKIPLPSNFQEQLPFDNGEMQVRDELLASTPRDPDIIRQRIADYYASVTYIDRQFARLLRVLEETDRRRNTLIVFMGDSGLAVGRHGLLGKQNLYDDAGIGVPWIMAGPGIPRNLRSDSLVCSIDLYPTLCELSGIPVPKTVDGRSVTGLFQQTELVHRDYVYAAYRDVQRTVVGPRFKLIEYVPQTRNRKGQTIQVGHRTTQLFDLLSDPWEANNLYGNTGLTDQVKLLREQMSRLRLQYGDATEASRLNHPDMHGTYEAFWNQYTLNAE